MPPQRALDQMDMFSEILGADRVGLFTDLDGTLTPIFDDPRETVLEPEIRDTLGVLSERLDLVAVVSGRGVEFLREVVGLGGVTYVGNHGMEVWGAGDDIGSARAEATPGLLEEAVRDISELGVAGLYVEDKGRGVSVHYRNASDTHLARSLVLAMMRPLAEGRDLKVREGKMVVELTPNIEVNKGTAVEGLVQEAGLTGAIVLGDDITDCDAFDTVHRLAERPGFSGAAVAVVDGETPADVILKSDYWLSGRGEVEEFLRWMAYSSERSERKP